MCGDGANDLMAIK
jgi:cation-transporting ATPase 13A2